MRLIVGLIAAWGVSIATFASAQGSDDVQPLCPTSTGEPGRLFVGIADIFVVPEVFDRVEADDAVAGYSLGVASPTVYAFLYSEGATALRFFEGEDMVYECSVQAVDFDPAVHSLESITRGNCDWKADRELPLLTGIAHIFDLPAPFVEVAVGNPKVFDIQPTSTSAIYAVGKSPGITDIVALRPNGVLMFQCPFMVQDATAHFAQNPVEDTEICRDQNGNLMRLSPGETVTYKREGEVRRYDPVRIADGRVVGPTLSNSETGVFQFRAQASGITSLIDEWIGPRGRSRSCLIVVE
ncbi:MAG: pilus assembly protein N-terminal domain-containing protein [Pseudomonadota bacterium]